MQIKDIGVLAAVIMIVAMLVIPLPPWIIKLFNNYKYYTGSIGLINIDEYARSIAVFNFSFFSFIANTFSSWIKCFNDTGNSSRKGMLVALLIHLEHLLQVGISLSALLSLPFFSHYSIHRNYKRCGTRF